MFFVIWIFNACCQFNTCDCFDECDRAIQFTLDTSGQFGYKIGEIDTLEIVSLDDNALKPIDTTFLILDTKYGGYNDQYCGSNFSFDINHEFYYTDDCTKNYNIIIKNLDTFIVRNIEIKGKGSDSKCCSCYSLRKKTFTVDSVSYDLSSSSSMNETILLKKH